MTVGANRGAHEIKLRESNGVSICKQVSSWLKIITPTFCKNKIFANIEVHIGCISISHAYKNPSKNSLA
jgi:hypothetical protein